MKEGVHNPAGWVFEKVRVEVREGAGLDVTGMGNRVMSEGSSGASTGPNFLLKGSLWLFCCK